MAKNEIMQTFLDADYTSNLIYWKSICGYVFTISGNAIYFNSIKQRSIAIFITKAEYII